MLEEGAFGIEENEKLILCYTNVIRDMEELIAEGWIRVVEITETSRDKEKKTRVFFPRNQKDKDVEFTRDELPDNC